MNRGKYFQRGARGVFTCCQCGRQTRLVDQGFDSECCPECWELAGQDNSVTDGAQTWEEARPYCEELLAYLVKKGGNAEKATKGWMSLWRKKEA